MALAWFAAPLVPAWGVTKAPAKAPAQAAPKKAAPAPAAKGRTPAPAARAKAAPAKNVRYARRTVPARPRPQSVPTPERYREIQEALASQGHFKGEANGTWGPDSVDALKRFQQEKNLAPSGKIDSLTLIALGLGPKRNPAAAPGPDLNTQPRPQDDHRRSEGSERP